MDQPRTMRAVPTGDEPEQAPGGRSPGTADPSPFLEALSTAAEHEFAVSERLDTKTRQVIAVAGAFFTIVQTVAFGSFAASEITKGEQTWMLSLAVAAIVALAAAVIASARQQQPLKVGELPYKKVGDDLVALLGKSADSEDERAAIKRLAEHYAGMIKSRRTKNKKRLSRYGVAAWLSAVAVLITTAELLVALTARI
jgi:hypothetical protein